MDTTKILKAFYRDPYLREAVASASARIGSPCHVKIDTFNGITIAHEGVDDDAIIEMTAAEKSLLLDAVGKSYAQLVTSADEEVPILT